MSTSTDPQPLVVEVSDDGLRSSVTAVHSGWLVRFTWIAREEGASLSQGPTELTVTPTPEVSEAQRMRGLSTSVLRELEKVLTGVVAEYQRQVSTRGDAGSRGVVQERVRALRGLNPRSSKDYYVRLRMAYEAVELTGSRRPIQDLADLLDLSPNTVKTRLRAARRAIHGME